MAFLTLNAIEIPVRDDSVERALVEIGEQSRAFDGTLRKSRQSVKRNLSIETPWLLATDALAYESLFLGLGDVWSFESTGTQLYSSKGAAPTGTGTQYSSAAKFGTGCARLTSGQTLGYSLSLTSNWTVCFWRSTDGTTWSHYIVRSDGAKWLNGVRADATSTTFLSASSTGLTLSSPGATTYFDDLVALPYKILDTWGPFIGVSTAAWGDLPKLVAGGDAILTTTVTVIGSIRDAHFKQGVMSGSMRDNLQSLSVLLEEA